MGRSRPPRVAKRTAWEGTPLGRLLGFGVQVSCWVVKITAEAQSLGRGRGGFLGGLGSAFWNRERGEISESSSALS